MDIPQIFNGSSPLFDLSASERAEAVETTDQPMDRHMVHQVEYLELLSELRI